MNKEGSCLLTILLFVALISFFCLHMWRTTVLLFDTTMAKQQFQQHYYLTQGLLTWGIDLCKNNFDALIDYNTVHKPGFFLEIPRWKLNETYYTGNLVCTNMIENNLYYIQIMAKLFYKKNILMQLACEIHKEFDAEQNCRYRISKWHLENKA